MRAFSIALLACVSITASAQIVFPLGNATEREIAGGETHVYTLEMRAGEYLRAVFEQRGIDVVVTALAPDQKKIIEIDSPNGAEGPEPVELVAQEAGTYRFEVRAFARDAPRARYEARIDEHLTGNQYGERLAAEASLAKAAQSETARLAIPLRTTAAGHDFGDLQPLGDIVGPAHVVAIGEATHGTREFSQIKHRLLEFLVAERGFNVFAIEAPMAEAFDINEYVLTGRGDPKKALTALYYWAWNTEEVLELVEWMRRYNADPAHRRKLKFYGFDMQHPQRPAAVTADYLKTVDPKVAHPPVLAMLANPFTSADLRAFDTRQKSQALAEIRRIRSRFDQRKSAYVRQSGEAQWAIAQQHAKLLEQFLEDSSTGMTGNVRARSMADNIRWILAHEGPGTRVVVSAHNNHVATEPDSSMGAVLRGALGSDLVTLGFAFNQGSFQAIEPGKGLREFTVPPAPGGSLDASLSAAAPPLAILVLRDLPTANPLRLWLAEPRITRDIGAVYRDASAADYLVRREIGRRYDVLVFVETTTAARRNPGVHVISATPLLAKPDNLDFEEGEVQGVPKHWLALPGNLKDFDFLVTTGTDSPRSGTRAAVIRREPGKHYGEMAALLTQFVDATTYRGKKIRFRASARVRGDAAAMFVWIRANRRAAAAVDERERISGQRWQNVEMIIDVPADATRIEYGMALTGDGEAWLDAAAVDVPESPAS